MTLTIETGHLADLYLPQAREYGDAEVLLRKMFYGCKSGTPRDRALGLALTLVGIRYRETVRAVVSRGGLLHLGVA